MRLLRPMLSTLFAVLCPMEALAGVHVVSDGETTSVPLDVDGGTVLQFPAAIRLVTATQSVRLERVGGSSGASSKSKKDTVPTPVLHLRATVASGSVPEPELVTVVLADGQAVPLQLVPTEGADPFAELRWPTAPADPVDPLFLGAERQLMMAMLRDDPYRRQVVNESWSYAEYPDLHWGLRRRFQGDGVQGFTFVVENVSSAYLTLDITALGVGWPSRLALAQVEDDVLSPCGVDPEHCWTVLRLVVRAEGVPEAAPSFSGAVSADGDSMPFVRHAARRKK